MKVTIKTPKIEFVYEDGKSTYANHFEYNSDKILNLLVGLISKVSEDTEKLKDTY